MCRARTNTPAAMGALAAVTCALAIAACGSSILSHKAGAAHAPQFVGYADCMRWHGVPDFPDPSGGGGINIAGTGINPAAPSFKAAQASCTRLLPGGGPGAQHVTEQQKTEMVDTAECMRRQGISGFPDPPPRRRRAWLATARSRTTVGSSSRSRIPSTRTRPRSSTPPPRASSMAEAGRRAELRGRATHAQRPSCPRGWFAWRTRVSV